MFDLTGKTALVTGASGGIGGPIAKALAERGAKVALSGTRREALEAVAAEIGELAVVVPCNLSDAEECSGLVAQAEEALGAGLDILVANAGITRDGLLMRMKDEDWEQVLNVNLSSYFRLAKSAMRGMMKRKTGRIIGITSVVGVTGNPGQSNYAASKAGMIGFSKALAQRHAQPSTHPRCARPSDERPVDPCWRGSGSRGPSPRSGSATRNAPSLGDDPLLAALLGEPCALHLLEFRRASCDLL